MSLTPRQELLQLERRLYRRNKALIEGSVRIRERGFAAYEARYRRKVAKYARVASHEELMAAVRAAEIVYVGDYHTCHQSQRSFLRILKALGDDERSHCLIGLELLHARAQPLIDAFLAGRCSEEQFVRKVGLKRRWIFDLWANFKPLFDFAKFHRIPIVGIDASAPTAGLARRDAHTAARLAELARRFPDRKLFVFIGDLHLAPQHLPAAARRALSAKGLARRAVVLYQNSEAVYWRLARAGLDHAVEVVQLDAHSFCRMHTPPIVCQQSYLNWLEHEEGAIDYVDAKHHFLELVERIAAFLSIKLGKEKELVEVYTCGDLSFLRTLREYGDFTPRELAMIRRQILASESYYVPKRRMVYLANLSLNHAAEEAAHFVKHCASGAEEPRELVDAFYANVLHEGLGFFGSKLVNPKRKCFHEKEFGALFAYLRTVRIGPARRVEYETARLVLEYKRFERRGRPLQYHAIFRQRPGIFFAVTHAIGYMFGDRLYYGLLDGVTTKEEIRELFTNPWRRENEPFLAYMGLLMALRDVKIPKRHV
ncbi:MAG: ChaN family lipoprotein [Deltaproteobacteria bacterium]|nr:ChaN family lipoprotein [Deltaproteobacteria bacterium]